MFVIFYLGALGAYGFVYMMMCMCEQRSCFVVYSLIGSVILLNQPLYTLRYIVSIVYIYIYRVEYSIRIVYGTKTISNTY